jgi:hypothetical protein
VLRYNYANLYHPGGEPVSLVYVIFQVLISVARFSWVTFILSVGAKYLNFGGKAVTYGSEAQLPFYIFHQTVILCVGWFVIRLDIGMIAKYLIIVVVSFILIMALYELLVRRFNVVRLLFGMRPNFGMRPTKQPVGE